MTVEFVAMQGAEGVRVLLCSDTELLLVESKL